MHRQNRFCSDAAIDWGSETTGAIPIRAHQMFRALAASPDLSLREKRILRACLLMREIYQTEMQTMALDKSRVVREQQERNDRFREKMLSGKGLRSWFFLLRHGEEAATDLDFNLREWITEVRQDADDAQRDRRREVTDFAMGREERWRTALDSAGPYAKKLFNEISVTGRSLTHFPDHVVRQAEKLPGLRQLGEMAPTPIKVNLG
jgi:hypothetical protein